MGPGNALMDKFIKNTYNQYYDTNGTLASKGPLKKNKKFLEHEFFKKPPKSLDKNSFIKFHDLILEQILTMRYYGNLSHLTSDSIIISQNFTVKSKTILISGGGFKNGYLMQS